MLQVDLEALRKQAAEGDEELDDAEGLVIEHDDVDDVEGDDDSDEKDEPTGAYIFMATAKGTVKKTPLVQFSRPRTSGLIALKLEEGDTLIAAAVTDGAQEVMMFSDGGKVIRFKESKVRIMGRNARGVRGMRLPEGQRIISMLIPEPTRRSSPPRCAVMASARRWKSSRAAVVVARASSPW